MCIKTVMETWLVSSETSPFALDKPMTTMPLTTGLCSKTLKFSKEDKKELVLISIRISDNKSLMLLLYFVIIILYVHINL